jgi:starch synthase (maltosyl-transferring)
MFYGKATPDRSNVVFVALTLNPHEPREAEIALPLGELGLDENQEFQVEELFSGRRFPWTGSRHVIRFDPQIDPAFIFRLTRPART